SLAERPTGSPSPYNGRARSIGEREAANDTRNEKRRPVRLHGGQRPASDARGVEQQVVRARQRDLEVATGARGNPVVLVSEQVEMLRADGDLTACQLVVRGLALVIAVAGERRTADERDARLARDPQVEVEVLE